MLQAMYLNVTFDILVQGLGYPARIHHQDFSMFV